MCRLRLVTPDLYWPIKPLLALHSFLVVRINQHQHIPLVYKYPREERFGVEERSNTPDFPKARALTFSSSPSLSAIKTLLDASCWATRERLLTATLQTKKKHAQGLLLLLRDPPRKLQTHKDRQDKTRARIGIRFAIKTISLPLTYGPPSLPLRRLDSRLNKERERAGKRECMAWLTLVVISHYLFSIIRLLIAFCLSPSLPWQL